MSSFSNSSTPTLVSPSSSTMKVEDESGRDIPVLTSRFLKHVRTVKGLLAPSLLAVLTLEIIHVAHWFREEQGHVRWSGDLSLWRGVTDMIGLVFAVRLPCPPSHVMLIADYIYRHLCLFNNLSHQTYHRDFSLVKSRRPSQSLSNNLFHFHPPSSRTCNPRCHIHQDDPSNTTREERLGMGRYDAGRLPLLCLVCFRLDASRPQTTLFTS